MLKPFFKTLIIVGIIGAAALAAAAPSIYKWRQDNTTPQVSPRPEIRVTIIEGKRREEIAKTMEAKGVCSEADFLTASADREGYLFPDTYRFFPSTPAEEVVSTMLENFSTKTRGLNLSTDNLILASIVEREAENNDERPLIAGIYSNRLAQNMKLDADPTVQYARDTNVLIQNPGSSLTFWEPITRSDYSNVVSPYNTYRQAGLPPTPIANPGLESLKAAASPSEHDYLYFFHRDGQMIMSKTFAEHNRKLNQ